MPNRKNGRGNILLATVILLALLGLSSLGSYHLAISLIKEARIKLHRHRGVARALENLLTQQGTAGTFQPGLNCREADGRAGVVSIHRKLCLLCQNHGPSIDFNRLLRIATPCPGNILTTTVPSEFDGLPTCGIDSSHGGSLTILDNLKMTRPVRLDAPGTIVSAGSIMIESDLTVEREAILLAGGDLEIASIRGADPQAHRVTVITARGTVTIGKLAPNVKVNRYELLHGSVSRTFSPDLLPAHSACVLFNLQR